MRHALFLAFVVLCASPVMGEDASPAAAGHLPTNDPLLKEQWYLFAPSDPLGKPGSINAIGAWKLVRPAEPIIVALLDGGVNWSHPDLADNIWTNEKEIVNDKDDDGNGYVDDINGWDFASNDYNPAPEPFADFPDHGSLMAGLTAAVPDNKIGIAGAGRNLRIMSLRVGGDFKADLRVAIPAAIRYAVRNGARVVVSSLHFDPDLQQSKGFLEAMREGEQKGVLFVFAASKGAGKLDDAMKTLAAFQNVLVVGCARKDGSLLPIDDPQTVVKMVAACEDMPSISFVTFEQWKGPGASLATALVGAAAATLISQEPELTPVEVIEQMQKTARRHPSMAGTMKAGGALDMEALLKSSGRRPEDPR